MRHYVYPQCPECKERVWLLPRPKEGDVWIHADVTPMHTDGEPLEGFKGGAPGDPRSTT